MIAMTGSDRKPGQTSSESELGPGPASIERLMTQLIELAQEVLDAQQRLRRLLSANRVIVTELSLPAVLSRIVETARDLVGAQYAALGVIGTDGLLEQFIHVGMDEGTVARIGELPKGRGLLGALIEDPHPIRLNRIRDDDRSSGFPAGHPAMTSFLGVPIQSRNEAYGNLYLTNREGGDFTPEDEDLVLALAATAGVAIENARLFGESRHRQRWLQASADITEALLNPVEESEPLQLISDSVLHLADADLVSLVVPAGPPDMLRVAVASGDCADKLRGMHYSMANSLAELAMTTGQGVRIGSAEGERPYMVHLRQVAPIQAAMAVALSGRTGAQGAIVAGRVRGRRDFDASDLEMAVAFANHAAVARELAAARADQQRLAVLEDRDRIARDLHDQVIQRLYASGLMARSLAASMRDERATGKLEDVVNELDDTIQEIRTTIFDLRAIDSAATTLRPVVLGVAEQVRLALGFSPKVRFSGPVDTIVEDRLLRDAEAVIREAATNAARHAHGTAVTIEVRAKDDQLAIEVADNGVGFVAAERRSGLANLQQRAERQGGTLVIDTAEGRGTCLRWTVPRQA